MRFDIPTKPLGSALNEVADKAGLRLLLRSQLVNNLRSPSLSGTFTADQAMSRLLAGTGLSYRITGTATITVFDPSRTSFADQIGDANGAIPLDPIHVRGTPDGTNGYVATRSSAGTKTQAPLIETPQSISVVTRQQMDTRNVRTLDDTIAYTPGINPTYGIGADLRYDWFTMRGFGTGYSELYRDGLKLGAGAFAIGKTEPYGIERVDIVRGPASVLYGANSPGGVVNVTTKRPTWTPQREVRIQYGSSSFKEAAFDIGGPVAGSDTFAYRLTGLLYDTDYYKMLTEGQRAYIAPAFTWRPNMDTSFTLLTSYQRDRVQGDAFLGDAGYLFTSPLLGNRNGEIPRNINLGNPSYQRLERDAVLAGYELSHRFNDSVVFRQNARYGRTNFLWRYMDGSALANYNYALHSREVMNDADLLATDSNLVVDWQMGGLKHQTLVGADTQYVSENYWLGRQQNVGTINLLNPVYNLATASPPPFAAYKGKETQFGVYFQDQIKYGGWTALLSGRYDWFKQTRDYSVRPATLSYKPIDDEAVFTGRAGLVYLFDSGIAPYVSYSTAFEPVSGSGRLGQAFKPMEGEQKEVGIKYEPHGMNARFSVALFDLVRKNVTSADPVDPNFSIQVGEARSKGLELEAVVNPIEKLNIIANYTYLDQRITQSTNRAEIGRRLAYIPARTAGVWVDYELPTGPLAGLGFGGGVRYIGNRLDALNTTVSRAYTVVDSVLRYRKDQWTIALNVNNLFDKQHDIRCFAAGYCEIARGRTARLSVSYKW